jgi:hypothetical protein
MLPPSQASPRQCWRASTPTHTTQTQTHATRYAAAVLTLAAGHSAVEHALRRRHANRLNSSHALVKQLDGTELDDEHALDSGWQTVVNSRQ